MSRSVIIHSMALSLLVLSSLAVMEFRERPGAPQAAFRARTDRRCAVAEREIAACNRRLEELEKIAAALAGFRPLDDDAPESQEPVAAEPADGRAELTSLLEKIISRVDELDRRVAGLEKHPLLRGFSFIESIHPEVRQRGVRALEDIARNDLEARHTLRYMLGDEDPKVRIEAIEVLVDIGDGEAIPGLRGLLRDPDAGVRAEAINGLVELDAKEEGASIAELLMDADEEVRSEAASALGALRRQMETGNDGAE